MSAPLTDEQVAHAVADYDDVTVTNALATEVQAYRALRPDCPTCGGERVIYDLRCEHCGGSASLPLGMTCLDHQPKPQPCPDCADGKMPLDKWVALLVDTLAPLPASLADIALTIPSCSHSDVQEGDCDWLLRAHVRRIDAVLKMVPKVAERRSEVTAEQVAP